MCVSERSFSYEIKALKRELLDLRLLILDAKDAIPPLPEIYDSFEQAHTNRETGILFIKIEGMWHKANMSYEKFLERFEHCHKTNWYVLKTEKEALLPS